MGRSEMIGLVLCLLGRHEPKFKEKVEEKMKQLKMDQV
jgi:hypothetical protein